MIPSPDSSVHVAYERDRGTGLPKLVEGLAVRPANANAVEPSMAMLDGVPHCRAVMGDRFGVLERIPRPANLSGGTLKQGVTAQERAGHQARTGDRVHPLCEVDPVDHGFEERDADGNPDLAPPVEA